MFANKFINNREKFAIQLYDGKIILFCYIEKLTPINVKSAQSFGLIQENGDTDIMVKALKKNVKIISNRINEK